MRLAICNKASSDEEGREKERRVRRRARVRTRKRKRESVRAKERGGYGVRGYIPQGCDSRTMYGYWAAGGIDSHDEGATDHPETETPAVPALLHLLHVLHPPPSLRSYV